jgi:cation:H+ antiporter
LILIYGANLLVEGAASLGRRFNLSSLVIGFTIVALGTSLPELIINIFASVKGETDLAITNVVGSNIMNTLLIIGISAMIFPVVPGRKSVWSLIPISFFSAVVIYFLIEFGNFKIDRSEGIFLILMLLFYLIFSFFYSKGEKNLVPDDIKVFGAGKSIILIGIGVGGLYFGGNWVVIGAVVIAENAGMSKALVGITILAVATSLPELATSVIAALKKNTGIALGNALGSNIFNIFLVLGASSIITPLPFPVFLKPDILLMILSNLAVLLFIYVGKGHKISRFEGLLMILMYLGYITYVVFRIEG